MHKIRIDIDRKTFEFQHPESFNELTQKQFTEVVRLVLMPKQPLSERLDDVIRLMYAFLGGFSDSKIIRKAAYRVTGEIIRTGSHDDLFLLQKFLYTEQEFNNWLVRKVMIGGVEYCGPDNRFSTLRFGEFIFADMLVTAYFGSKDPEMFLNKLAAVLMREKRKGLKENFAGDRRIDFDSDYLQDREELFAKEMDIETKTGILYNYLGIRNWLTKKYIFVFSTPESSSRTNIVLGRKENDWLSTRRHLAGSVLNLEKTDRLYIHDVLAQLNDEMSKL